MKQDYYRILGVAEDASEEKIKQKYRTLAKKYHPDANPGDEEAEKRFKEAGTAYAVLSDKGKRDIYDKERLEAKMGNKGAKKVTDKGKCSSQPMDGFAFSNMSADFEQFFRFKPESSQIDGNRLDPKKKTKADPINTTELFERYMGIKK